MALSGGEGAEEILFKDEKRSSPHKTEVGADGTDDLGLPGEDEADGIRRIFTNKGTYRPRLLEQEIWGQSLGRQLAPDDPDDLMCQLLSKTAPSLWRPCLSAIFVSCKTKETWQQALAHLIAIIRNLIITRTLELQLTAAPECITEQVLKQFLTGSNCKVSTDVESRVKVTEKHEGKHSHVMLVSACEVNEEVLKGMDFFLTRFLDLKTDMVEDIFQLGQDEGRQFYVTLRELCQGNGIQSDVRVRLDQLYRRHRTTMMACGFRILDSNALVWQRPSEGSEFGSLYYSIQGLYRSSEDLQTPL